MAIVTTCPAVTRAGSCRGRRRGRRLYAPGPPRAAEIPGVGIVPRLAAVQLAPGGVGPGGGLRALRRLGRLPAGGRGGSQAVAPGPEGRRGPTGTPTPASRPGRATERPSCASWSACGGGKPGPGPVGRVEEGGGGGGRRSPGDLSVCAWAGSLLRFRVGIPWKHERTGRRPGIVRPSPYLLPPGRTAD